MFLVIPGNKILNRMGLSLLTKTIGEGSYKVPELSQTTTENSHFCHLLRRFAGHVTKGEELTKFEETCLKKLASDCANYFRMKAYDWYSYTQVVSTFIDILKQSGIPQVSSELHNSRNIYTNSKDQYLSGFWKK